MAEKSWLEFSDDEDDESVDSEEARRIIDERLRKRKEAAELVSVSPDKIIKRSSTVGGAASRQRLPGVESRRRGGRPAGKKVLDYGLGSGGLGSGGLGSGGLGSCGLGSCGHGSCGHGSGGLGSCGHGSCGAGGLGSGGLGSGGFGSGGLGSCDGSLLSSAPSVCVTTPPPVDLNLKEINFNRPTEPNYRIVDDDVVFTDTYDIWFTDPSVASSRGTSRDMYDHACCYVGSFNKISEFYAFHNAIDWLNIPNGSVVAYTKKDIKPQWEDPLNAPGGRYMFKNFPRASTERVFTKLALGFLSGFLTDWHHYNLISLHVRSSARGTDIQFWRRIPHSVAGISYSVVLSDIKALLMPNGDDEGLMGSGALNWMPNSGSMQRNDNRMSHQRARRGGGPRLTHAASLDSGALLLSQEDVLDAWGSTVSTGSSACLTGSGFLTEDMRKAMVAAADAEINKVTPVGVGLQGGPKDAPATPTSTLSTVDSPCQKQSVPYKSEWVPSHPLKRTQNFRTPVTPQSSSGKPRRFCFSQVAELLPSSSEDITPMNSDHESQKTPSRTPLNKDNPYPAYDAPVSISAWQRGQALREQGMKRVV